MTDRRTSSRLEGVRAVAIALVFGSALFACSGCPDRTGDAGGTALSRDGLVERLLAERARRERMDGTVVARASGLRGFFTHAELDVAAERPGRLHLSARSFFGQPLFTVVSDGETLTLYDIREGQAAYARGPATAASIERLLGVPLSPADILDLLLGASPGMPRADSRVVTREGARHVVSGVRDDGLQVSIAVRATDDAIERVVLGTPPRALIVTLSGHIGREGGLMPSVVDIEWRREDTGAPAQSDGEAMRLRLDVKEARLNGPVLGDDAFTLSVPDGAPVGAL